MGIEAYNAILLTTSIVSGGLLAFSAEIAKRTNKKWIDNTWFKIFLSIAFVIINNYCSNKKEDITKAIAIKQKIYDDSVNESKQKIRDAYNLRREDSLAYDYKKQIDSSYTKSIKSSNDALARYNLILIDSLKEATSTIKLKAVPDPRFSLIASSLDRPIAYLAEEGEQMRLYIRANSYEAPSYNLNITCYILKMASFSTLKLLHKEVVQANDILLTDRERTLDVAISKDLLDEEDAIVVLKGTFSHSQAVEVSSNYLETFNFNFKKGKVTGAFNMLRFGKLLREAVED